MAGKEEKPNINAKNLIASFEKGEVTQNSTKGGDHEKPVSRPGAAKKLQQVYEDKSKPEPSPSISKGPAKKVGTGAPTQNGQPDQNGPCNVLIVFAHWERKSFNGAMLDIAVKSLEKEGHKVTVSDLYAMKWNPVPSKGDIKGDFQNKDHFNYLEETAHALQQGTLAKDIIAEHKKIQEADLVIFQFPLNWFSYPAILKGWFDRCLTNGFAFNTENGQLFDMGLMKGKKAVLSFTTGGKDTAYTNRGIDGDINILLWPMHYGTLRFAGFDILEPQISYNVMHTDDKTRQGYLTSWEKRLKSITQENPLNFISLQNFDPVKGLVLTDESPVMKEAKPGFGLTVGQNLGKPYPPNSMTGK